MKHTITKNDLRVKFVELAANNQRIDEYIALTEKWREQ